MRKKIKSGPTQIVLIVGHCGIGDTLSVFAADNTKTNGLYDFTFCINLVAFDYWHGS